MSIECFRLDTSADYVSWDGVQKRYVTNLVIIGLNHIKLLAVYHDGSTQ
jgi:hypothetical protein